MSDHARQFEELDLPRGESLVWQGRPDARALALRVFHVRLVAIYFALLFGVRIAMGISDRQPLFDAAVAAARLAIPFAAVMILLVGLAILYSRTTRYSVTNRRVLLQFGAVLPMTLNIPFRQIANAAVKEYPDGSGDLPIAVVSERRLAFLLLWPHVRPWRLSKVEPMLRCVPDARGVANLLSKALTSSSPAPEPVMAAMPVPRPAEATSAVANAA
ncbi:photosynthetic complex putative assembly protein PuhB [Bradyrhizobium guangzhouense]|uniref:PH domain-containing protein n=1 Tax=Bradyrhizobium guangzhouense TaxID=1325095 RepID=A0AAE6C6G1_9BRAD|nr:photosynthetic complex putative assembly protein PuhB [Bradyrhizobium guangzhouense]QAU44382.1 PH domain-containing protein [Bradyrhizobium guangzhouense]RXH09312.1 PH domain-containing protein [Bradyrhizobium guangzhouense]RXH10047.1 PH domain-containing protein [Bradyrhizobium guangzhouense]